MRIFTPCAKSGIEMLRFLGNKNFFFARKHALFVLRNDFLYCREKSALFEYADKYKLVLGK